MKKAYLITTELTTRIVLDDNELQNEELVASLVERKLLDRINNGEVLENITEIVEDTECPYED